MRIMILCTVPDEWRDDTDESGIREMPYADITASLLRIGVEDIDIQEAKELP